MHYTHCTKQGPRSIYHITIELDLSLHSAVCNQQIKGEGENKRGNVVRIREREGKKQRESKAESIMYLNQSISWCSCLLLWSLRMKTWCSSHCWGTQWTSITVPCECCWGASHYTSLLLFPSLDLPRASSSPDDFSRGSRDFFLKRCWCKCLQRHQLALSAFPLHSHTVTAEMEQEAERNRTRAAVSTGS